jgi:hypothetical protein
MDERRRERAAPEEEGSLSSFLPLVLSLEARRSEAQSDLASIVGSAPPQIPTERVVYFWALAEAGLTGGR